MKKDKALEELFLAQTPSFDDSDRFMASLTKRLDAVEYIKQHQEATIRRYKMALVAAFVVGIISGGITIGFILSMPSDIPLFTLDVQIEPLLWFAENARFIATLGLSLLMSFALISIVTNVQDILRMRVRLETLSA